MTAAWAPDLRQDALVSAAVFALRPAIPVEIVLTTIQREFDVTPAELLSPSKLPAFVRARAFAVWALRTCGPMRSYPEIARILSAKPEVPRNHSSIIHLHQQALLLRLRDAHFLAACQRLARRHAETTRPVPRAVVQ